MKLDTLNLSNQTILTIDKLCSIASKRLADCYGIIPLQNRININGLQPPLSMVDNLRYIIISQIGIKRWRRFSNDKSLPNLWNYISSNLDRVKSAGDLGLAIWSAMEADPDDCTPFVAKLTDNWAVLAPRCNAVELAWVVQGLTVLSLTGRTTFKSIDVLKNAHCRLIDLYCPTTSLFARHSRTALTQKMSRRVACFADQVYPIMALSNYGTAFDHRSSIDASTAAADKICQLQGPMGQWWWHYDVEAGCVAEEYPVFSVHQHSMAPMALLAADKAAERDHSRHIEKGLSWLNANNESGERMIIPDKDMTYRDIHRRELPKMYRFVRGILTASDLRTLHRLAGRNLLGYTVNRECRPYCLGWLLYCWADLPYRLAFQPQEQANKEKISLPARGALCQLITPNFRREDAAKPPIYWDSL